MEIVTQGKSRKIPPKMIIYGLPKTGKSTFASQADDVLFIDVEGGLEYLPNTVKATQRIKTFDEVLDALKWIHQQDKAPCKTIAIDSLDWIEELAQTKLIKRHNASSITDSGVKEFAYFKGVLMAAEEVMKVFMWLDAIYAKHGIMAIIVAHSQAKNVDLPGKDPFQRNELKLSKYLAAKVMEWGDLILYADYAFYVVDGKTTEPKRVLRTGEDASFLGGSRVLLPKELPVDYNALVKAIQSNKGETQ